MRSTRFSDHLGGGLPGGCCLPRGVSAGGGCLPEGCLPEGCLPLWGVCLCGVSASWGGGVCLGGVHQPPVKTLPCPKLRFVGGKYRDRDMIENTLWPQMAKTFSFYHILSLTLWPSSVLVVFKWKTNLKVAAKWKKIGGGRKLSQNQCKFSV